jgi:hypothetical protein
MAKSTRLLALVLSAGAIGVGSYYLLSGDDDDAAGTKRLVNQVWVERMPESRRDMIGHLSLIKHQRGRIGVVGKSSQWRHFIELFEWKLDGSKLRLNFPQDERKMQVGVRTWDCRKEAPDPFELCLEISVKDRKRIYYSRRDWVIDPHDVEGSIAELAEASPELAPVLENMSDDMAPTDFAAEVEGAEDWAEPAPDSEMLLPE